MKRAEVKIQTSALFIFHWQQHYAIATEASILCIGVHTTEKVVYTKVGD